MENLISRPKGVFAEKGLGLEEGFVEGGSGAFRND